MKLAEVELIKIRPSSFRQRAAFDQEKIKELADSIAAMGPIEPIVIRPFDGKFEIVVGERRVLAHEMLKLKTIPAIIRELSDIEAMEMGLEENVHRENLTSIERENAIFTVWEKGRQIDPSFPDGKPRYNSVSDFAKHVGMSELYLRGILKVKGIRDAEGYGKEVSSADIRESAPLPKEERRVILEKKVRGEILASDIGEVAKELKDAPPEVKKPFLEGRGQLKPEIIREVKKIEEPALRKEMAEKIADHDMAPGKAMEMVRQVQVGEAVAKKFGEEALAAIKGPSPEMINDADVQKEWVKSPISREIALLFRNMSNQADLYRILSRRTPEGNDECFCPQCGKKDLRWACCDLPVGKASIDVATQEHSDAVERGKAERDQIKERLKKGKKGDK